MRKKIISLALALTIVMGLMPDLVLNAEGEAPRGAPEAQTETAPIAPDAEVSAAPEAVLLAASDGVAPAAETGKVHAPNMGTWHFNVPLLNKQTMNSTMVLNNYVFTNKGLLTAGKAFTRYDYNKEDMVTPPSSLYDAYNHEFTKIYDNSSWYAIYRLDLKNTGTKYWNFKSLIEKGQISFVFSGDLKYDRHVHRKGPTKHWQLRDYAQTIFYYDGLETNQMGALINNSDQGDESWNSMKMGWTKVSSSARSSLDLMFTHDERTNCYCGSSGVRKPIIAFADTVSPSISSVNVQSEQYYYNKGDTITFTVNFDEYIRPADFQGDITPDEYTKVVLAAYDRVTLQSKEIKAQLVDMSETSLTFEYKVEDGLDVVITGIADAAAQRNNILHEQTLRMFTAEGDYQTINGNAGPIKVNAFFTDFAGNDINENWRGVSFPHELHVDTIDPEYTNTVIVSGSMLRDQDMSKLTNGWNNTDPDNGWSSDDIDRSQVFAGVGDWVDLAVEFSEELHSFSGTGAASGAADAKHFTATLNVLDAYDQPVTLTGSDIESYRKDINNNRPASRLHFETLHITEGMKPDPSYDVGPIKIVSIEVNGEARDMCENSLNLSVEYKDPDKQEWLDTLAPQVTVDSGPETYDDREGVKVSVQITEQTYGEISSPRGTE